MFLALTLPATLLAYLAGFAALLLGFGWLVALGVVMGTGTATLIAAMVLVSVGPRLRGKASAASATSRAPSSAVPPTPS